MGSNYRPNSERSGATDMEKPVDTSKYIRKSAACIFAIIAMAMGLAIGRYAYAGPVNTPCPECPTIDSTSLYLNWVRRMSKGMNIAIDKGYDMMATKKRDSANWYGGKASAYEELLKGRPW